MRGRVTTNLVGNFLFVLAVLPACGSDDAPAVMDSSGSSSAPTSGDTNDNSGNPSTTGDSNSGQGSTSSGSTTAANTTQPPATSGSSSSTGDGATTSDSSDGSTGEQLPDCDNIQPLPVAFTTVSGPASSEDFVLDAMGNLVNVVGNDMLQAPYAGNSTLVFPGVGQGGSAGTSMLSNGDLVFSSGNSVIRVASDGSTQTLAAGISYPNGLTVDMFDIVYVAAQTGDRVLRVNPNTLEVQVAADGDLASPNGLAFDRTYENLYIGSFGAGTVHQLHIATGTLSLFSSNIGTGGLDGVSVDECGNVYVTDFGPGIVYRVNGDVHEVVADLPAGWIPNMHFGTGVGGWDESFLYVMNISGNEVFSLDLGVKGIPLPHIP